MAYQGLASVLRPDSNTEELKKKAAKVKAKASSTKSIVGNVVGIPAAGVTGYLTGSPTAAMAAYQAGKGIGEEGTRLAQGEAISSETIKQLLGSTAGGAAEASGAIKSASAAKKAASATKKAASWLQFLKA